MPTNIKSNSEKIIRGQVSLLITGKQWIVFIWNVDIFIDKHYRFEKNFEDDAS